MRHWPGLLLLMWGCQNPLSPPVAVDPEQFWPEAEYRINHWLGWHAYCIPPTPSGAAWVKPVIDRVFEEVGDGQNCHYHPDSRSISVDLDVVAGCMAHELGHAALHQASNSC